MTQDDVLFGYRLQLFELAARTTVTHACRTFGVHRSTYYRRKTQVEHSGLEMLRPRERRRRAMPNQIPQVVEQRIVGSALGHPEQTQAVRDGHFREVTAADAPRRLRAEAQTGLPLGPGSNEPSTGGDGFEP